MSKIYIFYLSALDRILLGKKLIGQTNADEIGVQREIGIDRKFISRRHDR